MALTANRYLLPKKHDISEGKISQTKNLAINNVNLKSLIAYETISTPLTEMPKKLNWKKIEKKILWQHYGPVVTKSRL
jgi:hypothetical protein